MPMLLIERNGLAFDRCDYFPSLGKMRPAIRVVRILYEMRSHLAAVFEIDLRFPCARGRD